MESLRLTQHVEGGKDPSVIDVTVLDRSPIQATKSPTTHETVCLNNAWIKLGDLNPKRLSSFFPGGIIIPKGLSGGRELFVETHEVWREDGTLSWAEALDPRPIPERTRRFAVMGT